MPWSQVTVPAADWNRRADDAIDAEPRQSADRADDIDDGIDRPNFVKMHLLDRRAVSRGLDLGQSREDAAGIGFDRRRQVAVRR